MTDSGLETISEAAEPSTARTAPSHPAQVDPENPGSTDAPSNRSAQAAPRSRWRRPLLILGPVALVIGALGVEPQQVVLGQTEAADWRLRFYPPVRPMPVVSMKPVGQFLGAAV